jgi:phosphoglycerate dehydrogenase-like enzyme
MRHHGRRERRPALPAITPHIATESVKLSDAVVDFWCENLRRFAENQPLLGVVDRRAGY